MEKILYLGLFAPLAGFLGLLLGVNHFTRRLIGGIACGAVFISFLCFCFLLFNGFTIQKLTLFQWIPIDKIEADFSLTLDPLSLLMALIITGVGFLIHAYSVGYMKHEQDLTRYFACLNFFIFSMLLLVLASHLLLLFVGWEGVGLASYLLIGFWYKRPAAAQAATKAFIVNRIGDVGLLIGLLLTFHLFGTGDIKEIVQRAGQEYPIRTPIVTVLTLLYFWGATGKSAQIPLHTWLPDAMEGPTPVSALIHAATMVTAGVYLVVRLHEVFLLSPTTLYVIGIIGAITSLFAALWAIGQNDLKRILAYSTVSQLGLMFVATSAGAFYAAMFHLTMHAFVKALLFLSAGNILHTLQDETDIYKMGGLARRLPKTNLLFVIGILSMSGIPPLAAFFSKEMILGMQYEEGLLSLYYIVLAASILTGFYLSRAYFIAFLGTSRSPQMNNTEEVPLTMLTPLSILGILSVIGGFLGFCFCEQPPLGSFLRQLGRTWTEQDLLFNLLYKPETWVAVIGTLVAIAIAAFIYVGNKKPSSNLEMILKKGFYIDDIYQVLFVLPLRTFVNFIANIFEPRIVEGSITALANRTKEAAGVLQRVQSGQLRSYVAWMIVGSVLLLLYIVFE